jgi:hypothetical protein
MQITNDLLVDELLTITENALRSAHDLKNAGIERLNHKNSETEWSALECMEHLNLYGDFYLPQIEKRLLSGSSSSNSKMFRSGLIGNYFAQLMRVKDGKLKKMKSPRDKNPAGSSLSMITVDRFIKQLEKLRLLLNSARSADLTHIKVPISLTKFIKLRLGDTFRFFTYHIERHMQQAEKACNNASV